MLGLRPKARSEQSAVSSSDAIAAVQHHVDRRVDQTADPLDRLAGVGDTSPLFPRQAPSIRSCGFSWPGTASALSRSQAQKMARPIGSAMKSTNGGAAAAESLSCSVQQFKKRAERCGFSLAERRVQATSSR